jgi:hypothetical protein
LLLNFTCLLKYALNCEQNIPFSTYTYGLSYMWIICSQIKEGILVLRFMKFTRRTRARSTCHLHPTFLHRKQLTKQAKAARALLSRCLGISSDVQDNHLLIWTTEHKSAIMLIKNSINTTTFSTPLQR